MSKMSLAVQKIADGESGTRELSLIADGARMLAEARDLFEVQQVRGLAKAAVAYAKAKDLGEDAVRSANRIVILATLRLGQEIVTGQERGEIAKAGKPVNVVDADNKPAVTLPELGIGRDLSSVGQRFARNVEAIVDYAHQADMPTQAGALRAITQESENALVQAVETPEDRYRESVDRIDRLMGDALTLAERTDLTKPDREKLSGRAAYLTRILKGTYDDETFDAARDYPQPRLIG